MTMGISIILTSIYRYYPRNISVWDEKYWDTNEFKARLAQLGQQDTRWDCFFSEMTTAFGSEYVRNRTDQEPSFHCVIYISSGDSV